MEVQSKRGYNAHFHRLPEVPLPKSEIILQHRIEGETCLISE